MRGRRSHRLRGGAQGEARTKMERCAPRLQAGAEDQGMNRHGMDSQTRLEASQHHCRTLRVWCALHDAAAAVTSRS